MPELRIGGTPHEVLKALQIAKTITSMRKTEGWNLFQSDEFWSYETRMDARVCLVCNSFQGIFPGEEIPTEFPDRKVWGTAHVKPGVHITYPYLKWSDAPDAYGGCRCNIYWPDYINVLIMRLDDELRASITGAFEAMGYVRQ